MATKSSTQAVADFDWEKSLEEVTAPEGGDAQEATPGPAPLDPSPGGRKEKGPNLDLLLDVPLEITAELGRTRMIINDLLQLGQGSVIELNKLAGEPLEILVNHKLVARGEVVVVNEKFGIRLTDIVSPLERIKHLG
jgi:flagellar motor switch protein FliN/FliY